MISARIGRVTGHGLASNIRRHYPAPVLYAVVSLLFVANTINVAPTSPQWRESVHLVAGGPTQLYAVAFGAVCLGLEIFMSYRKYVRYLKWLTLCAVCLRRRRALGRCAVGEVRRRDRAAAHGLVRRMR